MPLPNITNEARKFNTLGKKIVKDWNDIKKKYEKITSVSNLISGHVNAIKVDDSKSFHYDPRSKTIFVGAQVVLKKQYSASWLGEGIIFEIHNALDAHRHEPLGKKQSKNTPRQFGIAKAKLEGETTLTYMKFMSSTKNEFDKVDKKLLSNDITKKMQEQSSMNDSKYIQHCVNTPHDSSASGYKKLNSDIVYMCDYISGRDTPQFVQLLKRAVRKISDVYIKGKSSSSIYQFVPTKKTTTYEAFNDFCSELYKTTIKEEQRLTIYWMVQDCILHVPGILFRINYLLPTAFGQIMAGIKSTGNDDVDSALKKFKKKVGGF